jgi:hypothetical protein
MSATAPGAVPLGVFTRDISAPVEAVELRTRAVLARVGSNEIDRYQTCVCPSGIDYAAFNRSGGPVLWMHGKENRGALPVGKAQVRYRSLTDTEPVHGMQPSGATGSHPAVVPCVPPPARRSTTCHATPAATARS